MTHPLASESTSPWATPFPAQQQPAVPDGLDDAQSLQFLALQGRWREVALRCTTGAAAPNASLSFVAYHTLALLKLSMNEQAAAELSKLKSQHVAVSNADSTAPWALRVLRSEVLWALGKRQAAIDWLYQLLEWCNAQEGSSVAAAASGGDGQQQVQLGRLRRRDIALNLVSKLRQQRQFVPALLLLNHLLGADAADLQAWMAVCSVQALLGDVSAAQATLRQVEQLLAGSSGGAGVQEQAAQRHHHQQLLHRHRGTLHFLQRDFRGAAREFAAAQKLDPSDAVAINNHALALMYSGQLLDAVQELESGFRHVPAAMMQVAFGLLQFISSLGTCEAAGGVDPPIALAELLSLYQLPAGPQLPAAHGKEESEQAVECTGPEVWQLLQVRARLEQDLGPVDSLRVEVLSCVAAAQGPSKPQEGSGGRQWLERLLQLCAAQ